MNQSRLKLFCGLLLGGVALSLFAGCLGYDSKSREKREARKAKKAADRNLGVDQKAGVGVGKKGKGYGDKVSYLKPASTLWRAKEKITFELQINPALRHFQALNGRSPKNWEEFEREILKPGRIKLPELDAGLEYYFNSEKGELWVRSTQQKN